MQLDRPETAPDAADDRPVAPAPGARDVTIVAHHVGSVGGMERQLADLALGLRRRGHHVTVIARACELPAEAGVAFHRVRGPSRPFVLGYPWFMLAGSLAVRRWRRGILQATGAIIANRVDVVGVHYCHQVGVVTPSRTTPVFRAHIWAMRILSRVGERVCFASAAAAGAMFVCVSEGVADEIRTYYPELSEAVVTIHNGVDTDAFAPGRYREQARVARARLDIGEERLVAVFVGGEWVRKGLGSAIEALALAAGWDLIVVGSGDERHYRDLAERAGVAARVHWMGVVHDVHVAYQMADAFVLPSSYETFSFVTFEAAASGLAVLATAVSGVRELIEDGVSGFVIEQDAHVIAARLTQLEDPQLRARLGQAARRSALRFGRERMVAAYQRLYGQIASGEAAGSRVRPPAR
jgi:glycosyltransferase involved in cell wall biosynthesis